MKSCKICSQEVKVISNSNLKMLVPDGYPLDGDLDIRICQNCDFIFSSSKSSDTDYLSYYQDFNKHQNRDEKIKFLIVLISSEYVSLFQSTKPEESLTVGFWTGDLVR